jgi:glycosyltransferase involved in cell wall biosynthesis
LLVEWHLITPEFPPQPGGVADYTRLVAGGLACAGDVVHVWCPPTEGLEPAQPRVHVHRDLGDVGPAALARLGKLLDEFPRPRRLFVQWAPHGYGWRAMNVAFCSWLHRRATRAGDSLEIMVHEPFLFFGGSWKQWAAALVQRFMMAILLNAARKVWVSTSLWQSLIKPCAFGRSLPVAWLPVPSTIAPSADAAAVAAVRAHYARGDIRLLGHFGTYRPAMLGMLACSLPLVLRRCPRGVALLLGRGGDVFRKQLCLHCPDVADRIHATGELPAEGLSSHISACDVMIQPYSGGVNGRSTTIMAALAHGKPVATTQGIGTEPVWLRSGAVAMVPDGDVARLTELILGLLADDQRCSELSKVARAFYQQHFLLKHTIAALRGDSDAPKGNGEATDGSLRPE